MTARPVELCGVVGPAWDSASVILTKDAVLRSLKWATSGLAAAGCEPCGSGTQLGHAAASCQAAGVGGQGLTRLPASFSFPQILRFTFPDGVPTLAGSLVGSLLFCARQDPERYADVLWLLGLSQEMLPSCACDNLSPSQEEPVSNSSHRPWHPAHILAELKLADSIFSPLLSSYREFCTHTKLEEQLQWIHPEKRTSIFECFLLTSHCYWNASGVIQATSLHCLVFHITIEPC